MADAYGSWAGSYGRWRCHIHYGIESQNDSSAVVYCQTRFNTNAWGFDVFGTDKATVNGVTKSQSTVTHYSASGQTVDTTMITQRQTISKGTSAKSISVSGSIQITGGYQNGTSSASGSVSVPAIPVTIPGTPSNVAASRTADNNIRVTWTLNKPSSGSISKNTIQVQIDDGSWTTLSSSLSATATSYSYTAGTANHRYCFRVSSTSSAGTSGYGTSGYVYTTPATPSSVFGVQYDNLKGVTAVVSNVNWCDHVEWQRSTNNSSWTTISGQSETSITDDISTDRPYYRCRAVAPSGLAGSWSSGARVSKAVRAWVNSSTPPEKIFINVTSGSLKGVYYQAAQGIYHISD